MLRCVVSCCVVTLRDMCCGVAWCGVVFDMAVHRICSVVQCIVLYCNAVYCVVCVFYCACTTLCFIPYRCGSL